MLIQPVILSGGTGSRLWPLSRESYPKQLLPLINKNSLFQETVLRVKNLENINPPIIICNEQHRFIVAAQLQELGVSPAKIILEPVGKNTAPAAALAALQALSSGDDMLLLIMPTDHIIEEPRVFLTAIQKALPAAMDNYLVTFGIKPSHPETGYGYIKKKAFSPAPGVYEVEAFIEKPSLPQAQELLKTKNCYWNSGIFLFKASIYIQALTHHVPEIAAHCANAFEAGQHEIDFLRIPEQLFTRCPADSIDYAIMEKEKSIAMVPMAGGWNDLGSWNSLHDIAKQDEAGNAVQGDVITMGVKNCYIRADERMIAAIGLQDQVIIETSDAVLVVHKDHCQDVKSMVAYLQKQGRSEHVLHKKVYRPWGHYESLISGTHFQVKLIIVNPCQRLSMQMHHHRAEHWVIVSGTAKVTRDNEEFILTENQSTYLPVGSWHRLENPGKLPLKIIEVQSGSYLGEDDILRFSDDYGRSPLEA